MKKTNELPSSASENPIKAFRERIGLSQPEFADFLEIPLGTIRSWEQGRRTPPDFTINLIKRVLNAELAQKENLDADKPEMFFDEIHSHFNLTRPACEEEIYDKIKKEENQ